MKKKLLCWKKKTNNCLLKISLFASKGKKDALFFLFFGIDVIQTGKELRQVYGNYIIFLVFPKIEMLYFLLLTA